MPACSWKSPEHLWLLTPRSGVRLDTVWSMSVSWDMIDGLFPDIKVPIVSFTSWQPGSWLIPSLCELVQDELGFHQIDCGFCPLHYPSRMNHPSDQLQNIWCMNSPPIWASLESLHYLVSVVQLATGIFRMRGQWGVYEVHLKEVHMEELSRKMLADWLDSFPAGSKVCSVYMMMMALCTKTP